MPLFELIAGQHTTPDPDRPRNEATGLQPTKTYNQGDDVESDDDLVKKFGSPKFRLKDPHHKARPMPTNKAPVSAPTDSAEKEVLREHLAAANARLADLEKKLNQVLAGQSQGGNAAAPTSTPSGPDNGKNKGK